MTINQELETMKKNIEQDISLQLRDNMMMCKKEVIDYAFQHQSINKVAELGCVWGVEGVYGRYIAEKHKNTQVTMVDTHWTDEAIRLCEKYPNIKRISENFGAPTLPEQIGKVDAIILYDVLLHQVAPDWNRILEIYAPYTDLFLIVNHQFLASATTTRLLDLGENDYFNNVPHEREHPAYKALFSKMFEIHPEHNRIWRDVHHVWQWGITDFDLMHTMNRLNFSPAYMKNTGNCGGILSNWEYVAFVFRKNTK